MVKECTRCLYTSDHALGIIFDDEGVCSGCRTHEEKDYLDWYARWDELEKLVAPYKSNDAKYDCIVPVGGKDSFYIVHNVVNRLKLKPLLVSYNKYFNTPVGIDNLAQLRINFNVDLQLKNVDPKIVKKLTKTSLYEYGNPYWPALAGETVFPIQTAVMMKIPLIIWGAHQGLEQVGMFSHLDNVEMTRRYRKDHDLFAVEAQNFYGPFDDIVEEDVINYLYPAFSDIEAIGLRGIYLGNYVRWDPYAQHIQMVKEAGFKGYKLSRTFDNYDHADCFVYSNVHDLLKLFKHGYSKVTDQASREIRHGRLTKMQAKKIVSYYETRQPANMDLFCEWLGVETNSMGFVLNRHRNPKHWVETKPNKWHRQDEPAIENMQPNVAFEYPNTQPELAVDDNKRRFITIGRGVSWPSPPNKLIDSNQWI